MLLSVGLLIAGCNQQTEAPAETGPTEVGVYEVTPEPYTVHTTLPGRVRAYMTSGVRPQVEGIIRERLFEEGAQVAAGDVLYRIDPARYEAAVEQAEAELSQARAAVQSAAPLARRYRELAEIDAISRQQRDDAVAELARAEADVATARAALRTARINLDYTRVKAPIAGQISASRVTPGALVTTNQAEPLATITQLEPVYVDMQQSVSAYLALQRAIERGALETSVENTAPVMISPERGDIVRRGQLQFAGVTVDEQTATVTLRALVDNEQRSLLPGMYVQARLTQGIDRQSILLPQQGVRRDPTGQPTALVVTPSGQVERRVLEIAGSTDDNRWRITDGLAAGDRVIMQGADRVSPGDVVDTVPLVVGPAGQMAPPTADGSAPADTSPASDDAEPETTD